MQTITHILESLKTLSTFIFIFSTNIEPLTFLNRIPNYLLEKIDCDEFKSLLNNCIDSIEKLNSYLKSIEPDIKRASSQYKKAKADSTIPYADFTVDPIPPIIHEKEPEQLCFEDIQNWREVQGFKKINPIKHRSDSSFDAPCPHCNAPKEYIYLNNGKEQFKCKVCTKTFTTKTTIADSNAFYCPYCNHKLSLQHDRKNYHVLACINKKCSFYLENKAKIGKDKEALKTSSNQYKLRYTYRSFNFNMSDLNQVSTEMKTKVNLSRIHVDSNVLGLILTYYVNYGLSARKTASILRDIHGVKISHQTVLNYATSTSTILNPYLTDFKYNNLTSILSGDETYIKVRGKSHYVFFFSDPNSKVITSHKIYSTRDTMNACQAIYDSLKHFTALPEDLLLITDGNPIYNAAQLFFGMQDIKFDLKQVIGVSNKDETSKTYRKYKQVEERLNRTYKMNYYGTNGYDKLETANSYMVLYVAFFNFLRKHSSLNYHVPYEHSSIDYGTLMPNCWCQLIDAATQARFA